MPETTPFILFLFTRSRARRQPRFEHLDEALFFMGLADADPDPLGQLVASHGPDDDPLALQVGEGPITVPYPDQHEVGKTRHILKPQLLEGFLEVGPPLVSHRLGPILVCLIAYGRQGRRLSHCVGIKRLASFIHHLGYLRCAQSVADSQSGKPLDLRKRVQDHHLAPLVHELERVRRALEEFIIGLVKDDNHVFRDPGHEAIDLLLS